MRTYSLSDVAWKLGASEQWVVHMSEILHLRTDGYTEYHIERMREAWDYLDKPVGSRVQVSISLPADLYDELMDRAIVSGVLVSSLVEAACIEMYRRD